MSLERAISTTSTLTLTAVSDRLLFIINTIQSIAAAVFITSGTIKFTTEAVMLSSISILIYTSLEGL